MSGVRIQDRVRMHGQLALVRAIPLLTGSIVACFTMTAVYLGNTWSPPVKLAWGALFGAAFGFVAATTVAWVIESFAWARNLLGRHGCAFWRVALPSGLLGLLLGGALWEPAVGIWPGIWLMLSTGCMVGFVAGAAAAQEESFTGLPGIDQPPHGPSDTAKALATSCILTLLVMTIPRVHTSPQLDPSWGQVLVYAHQHGWQYGKDLVFSYGPLGFLTVPWFSSANLWLRMLSDAAIGFTVSSGVCFLAWQLPLLWRAVLIGVFAFFGSWLRMGTEIHARVDLLILVGLLCWGCLCLLANGRRALIFGAVFAAFSAFAILVKVSLLPAATASILSVSLFLLVRRNYAPAALLITAFTICLVSGWIASEQRLINFPAFVSTGLTVANDYDAVMGYEAPAAAKWGAVATLLPAVLIVFGRCVRTNGDKQTGGVIGHAILIAWGCSLLFLVFKYGFVIGERYHLEVFFGFVPMMAVIALALPNCSFRPSKLERILAVVACVSAILTLSGQISPEYLNYFLARPLSLLTRNARDVAMASQFWNKMSAIEQSVKMDGKLPGSRSIIADASVDVFGNEPAYALMNRLNYTPRPVFQSFVAYNSELMHLNEEFYSSQRAPSFILFNICPFNNWLPSMPDAMALRYLLVNYEPVNSEGQFLLLKSTAHNAPKLRLLKEDMTSIGARIPLQVSGDTVLWIQIDLRPTAQGRIRRLLYKSPAVSLDMWGDAPGEKLRKYDAPPPMLAAGFIASPLLLNNEDVQKLYSGELNTKPTACSVELPSGTKIFWAPKIRYRIYELENVPGRRFPKLLQTTIP